MSWARLLLPRCSCLKAAGDLVERDDSPEVVPHLDLDAIAAPVPGSQAIEIGCADEQHANTALADDLAVLARHRHEPLIPPERS